MIASFYFTDGNVHAHILNEKISPNKTLESIKEDLHNVKEGILNCLVENINDQNKEGSICHPTSALIWQVDRVQAGKYKVVAGNDQEKKMVQELM